MEILLILNVFVIGLLTIIWEKSNCFNAIIKIILFFLTLANLAFLVKL